VIAAEHDERLRIERLDADRDPVDPGLAPCAELFRGAVGRVRLDRDLDRSPPVEPRADRGDRARDAVGTPQRRRAAPEVDRDQLPGKARRTALQLDEDRVEIGLVRRLADLDREVAVRAQLAAPREVEVDA